MSKIDELPNGHTPVPHANTGHLPKAVVQDGPRGRLVTLVDEYSDATITAEKLVDVEQ